MLFGFKLYSSIYWYIIVHYPTKQLTGNLIWFESETSMCSNLFSNGMPHYDTCVLVHTEWLWVMQPFATADRGRWLTAINIAQLPTLILFFI